MFISPPEVERSDPITRPDVETVVHAAEGLPTPKYGNIAIATLIEKVQALSNPVDKLIAKLFDGASMWEKTMACWRSASATLSLPLTPWKTTSFGSSVATWAAIADTRSFSTAVTVPF